MLTPTTFNPCGAYCFANSFSMGYSSRQGSHQVAQNVTSSGFPWYCTSNFREACASMSSGSRSAAVLGACGADRAVAAASKQSTAKPVWILMVIPSALILSAPPPVEKLLPTAYNSSRCLSLRAAAWYKEFLRWWCFVGWAPARCPDKGDP